MEIKLSETDVQNLKFIQSQTLDSSSNHVIATALELAATLITKQKEGYKIVLEKRGSKKLELELSANK